VAEQINRISASPWAIAVSVALAVGCGSAARTSRTPAGDAVDLPDVPGLAEGKVEAEYELPRPGAERYVTDRQKPAPAEGIVRRVIDRLGEIGYGDLERDGRLDRAAAVILNVNRADIDVSIQLVRQITWWLGIPEAAPAMRMFLGPEDAERVDKVASYLAGLSAKGDNLFGIAAEGIPGGVRVVVVAAGGQVELEPVPRSVPGGQRIEIAGRVTRPFTGGTLEVTGPDGVAREVETSVKGKRFSAEFVPDSEGKWQIEVVGKSSKGPHVLANFPLFVGVEPEGRIEVVTYELESRDPAELEDLLFKAINASRRASGLEPVTRSRSLDRICRAYSEEMARTGKIDHVSEISGDLPDRLEAGGVEQVTAQENLAKAHSAAESHMGLMQSPGHRANILNPLAGEVGVGVALVEGDVKPSVIVTQVFSVRPEQIDDEQVAEQVLAALDAARKASSAPPIERNRKLDRVARQAAGLCFAGSEKMSAGLAELDIDLKKLGFSKIATPVYFTNSPSTFGFDADDKHAVDREFSDVGIAVAQGTHPQYGEGIVCIPMAFGRR
jgi:uncharacterized protein YkwD